jgi:hypothetical protein
VVRVAKNHSSGGGLRHDEDNPTKGVLDLSHDLEYLVLDGILVDSNLVDNGHSSSGGSGCECGGSVCRITVKSVDNADIGVLEVVLQKIGKGSALEGVARNSAEELGKLRDFRR